MKKCMAHWTKDYMPQEYIKKSNQEMWNDGVDWKI
jgi:hypothetical protein